MRRGANRQPFGRRRLIGGALAIVLGSSLLACRERLTVPFATPVPARRPQALPDVEPPTSPSVPLDVEFGRTVRLEGVSVEQELVHPGDFLRIWLHWQAATASQEDLRALGQVVGPNGRVVAKEDDQIGPRKHFLSRWRPGDRRVDEMRIRIGPSTAVGEYGVVVAVLRPDNETTVPITAQPSDVARWGEDAVLVKTIEVGAG